METKVFLLSLTPFREKYPDATKREIEKIAGDYAVRKVFSELFGLNEIKITRGGKPVIKDCPYHFNLSHSGDWLLLAVGDAPMGADIEKITKIRPKTMERYFSQSEQERVKKNGTKAFFEIWCQKESYVKYTGEGIKALSKDLEYPEDIAFFTETNEDYQISVCTKKEHLPSEIELLKL
ncbi:MAG: 4'-phosphopantetheinyl transferase superfamily protein [Clostridia bacterium]|nr:4'-phosphopantetheinyl transferase superfamily protein [Clostridia bacterium]